MHKIVYLPLAQSDLLEAVEYITLKLGSPGVLEEFDRTVRQIADFPYACELYRTEHPVKEEIRKVPVKNYVLYYAVYPEYVELRRFLHGRRDRSKGIV